MQHLVNVFWKRWTAEYLPQLQSRQKWLQPRDNVKIGDLVLLVYENSTRGCWPLGLVVEVIQGRDGMVRSVKMRSKGKLVVRPITKVVFIQGSQ